MPDPAPGPAARGLIWGAVDLDGHDIRAVLESLSGAVLSVNAIGPVSSLVEGAAGLAQAALAPPGAPPPLPVPVLRHAGGIAVADYAFHEPVPRAPETLAQALAGTDLAALAAHEGDFAAAFWDPGPARLTLARDGFGIRPLFLARQGSLVAFASTQMMLVAAGLASDAPDPVALTDQLEAGSPDGERTFLRDVRRVRPGHLLSVTRAGERATCYWRPELPPPARRPDFAAAAAELRSLLDAAVRRRLPPSGDAASHLSGGLDSSAIAVLAARAVHASGREVFGYSVRTRRDWDDVEIADESAGTDLIQQHEPGIRLVPVAATDVSGVACEEMRADFPFPTDGDDYAVHESRIAAHAAARGVGVILSGFGGQEAASAEGRGALAEHALRLRFGPLLRELRLEAAEQGRPPLKVLAGQIAHQVLPEGAYLCLRRALGLGLPPNHDLLRRLLKPGARRPPQRLQTRADTRANRLAWLRGAHGLLTFEYLATIGAERGVAYAFPFLDRALIAHALSLPTEFLLRDGMRRALFREAMQGVLPETVRMRRRKLMSDAAIPLRIAERREAFADTIAALRGTPADDLFDLDALARALAELPEADAIKAEINARAAEGRQADFLPAMFYYAVMLARFAARSGGMVALPARSERGSRDGMNTGQEQGISCDPDPRTGERGTKGVGDHSD